MFVILTISVSLGIIFLLEGIVPHIRGRHNRIQHALPNLVVASLNGIISVLFFSWLTLAVINWTDSNSLGILHFINSPFYVKAILAFILFDLWMYLWHVANHRILFLWRFHRLHHSDLQVDTTTAMRFHPFEFSISYVLRFAIIPLIGMNSTHLLIYGMLLYPISIFHHSNVGLPERWDRIFRALIVTPNMHRVHHSQEWFETNSNYASVFSFWDRLFRNFIKREDTSTIKYGLKILQEPKWQNLKGMLLTAFK
jgi:sterol desaturase/sphingolipid hydroxylase (fatty acid hydroxylase superfamily)